MPILPACRAPILPSLMQKAKVEVPELVLVDVGCSNGIESMWNPYSRWLRVYGIDPLSNEIDRLKREEKRPNINYYAGSVTGPAPPVCAPPYQGWFERVSALAAHKTLNINYEEQVFNSGLAPVKSEREFTLDQFCQDRGLTRVDFVKSDTDGHDFAVLRGGEKTLSTVLGVLVEVTFCTEGSGSVFRDIDSYMDRQGLCCVGVNQVTYTRAALPGHFNHPFMADTAEGACSMGEVLYLRDIVRHGPHDLKSALRLAMIAELFNLPDVGAEALVAVQDQASSQVESLLDGLVRYSGQPDAGSYRELMRRFNENPRLFAPPAAGAATQNRPAEGELVPEGHADPSPGISDASKRNRSGLFFTILDKVRLLLYGVLS